MKIWKLEQLKQQVSIDNQVLVKAEEILKVLNVHYGEDRLVTDLGGYILLEQEEINDFIKQYSTIIPEYIEPFEGDDSKRYVEVLFMLSSDDHVVIYLLEETLHQLYPTLVRQYEAFERGE